LIDTITTRNFYLKFKEYNENDMAAQVFRAVFYSSRQLSQISQTADFDGAAIPSSIFSMMLWNHAWQTASLIVPTVLCNTM
jgi:hypothetical protein